MKDIFARMRMNIIFNRVSTVMRIIRITVENSVFIGRLNSTGSLKFPLEGRQT